MVKNKYSDTTVSPGDKYFNYTKNARNLRYLREYFLFFVMTFFVVSVPFLLIFLTKFTQYKRCHFSHLLYQFSNCSLLDIFYFFIFKMSFDLIIHVRPQPIMTVFIGWNLKTFLKDLFLEILNTFNNHSSWRERAVADPGFPREDTKPTRGANILKLH